MKTEDAVKGRFAGLSLPVKKPVPSSVSAPPSSSSDDQSFHSKYLLSDPAYPISKIRKNPANEVFRKYKTRAQLDLLKLDILEHGIVESLVLTQDGLLLEGESRLICLEELVAEGHSQFSTAPVKIHDEPLSDDESTLRLLRSNLTRFEIPSDDKLFLIVAAFPKFAADPNSLTRGQIAALANVSEEQAKRLKRLARIAFENATSSGSATITKPSLDKARETVNASRRDKEKTSPPSAPAPQPSPPEPSSSFPRVSSPSLPPHSSPVVAPPLSSSPEPVSSFPQPSSFLPSDSRAALNLAINRIHSLSLSLPPLSPAETASYKLALSNALSIVKSLLSLDLEA